VSFHEFDDAGVNMPQPTSGMRAAAWLATTMSSRLSGRALDGLRTAVKSRAAKLSVVLGVTLLGVCAGLLAFYLWLTHGEIQENRYDAYDEARESLDRGWLPPVLPRSAKAIHEWHDLDTGRCFGSFRFDPSERVTIESMLRPGLRPSIRIDRDPSFASAVPLDSSEEQLENSGFGFYSVGAFAFAINWDEGIAYFWKESS